MSDIDYTKLADEIAARQLHDGLWTRTQLKLYFSCGDSTLSELAAMPGFPEPRRFTLPSQKVRKMWVARDVRDWAEKRKPAGRPRKAAS